MPTKKTTTSTRSRQKNTKTQVENNVKEAEVKEEVKVVEPKRKLQDGDYIMCHSVTAGGLNINCRSRNHYEYKDYGAIGEIEYRDLVELVRKHSDHIFVPRIVVDDEEFLNEFPELKRFYAEQYNSNDLKEILRLEPDQMEREIKALPSDVFGTIRSLAATMVGTGEIDSVRKVRVLTDVFGTDFNLLSELFGK